MREPVAGSADSCDEAIPRVSELLDLMEESGDLHSRLTRNGSTTVSGLGGSFYAEGAPEFNLSRAIPIPEELLMQIQNMRTQFCMGIFTEISRAWITVDSDIFMWNYETNSDLAYFDKIESTVMKIDIVKLKPDVFSNQFTYGLIVGTVRDLTLYPMVVEGSQKDCTVSVDATHNFRVNIDEMTIGDITTGNNGRIFFSADTKLFEFVYEHHKGWFRDSKKCRIVNLSSNLFSSLIPFIGGAKEELEQIIVDKTRNILYTSDRAGTLQMFDLGDDGLQCIAMGSFSAKQIAQQANNITQCAYEESTFTNIVTIRPLSAQLSPHLNLVAITTKGVRIYLSAYDKAIRSSRGSMPLTQSEVRPQRLRVSHVRFAPGVVPTSLYGENNARGVCIAYFDGATTVMALAGQPMVYVLSNLYFSEQYAVRESKTCLEVPGNVWAIEAITEKGVPEVGLNSQFVPTVQPHAMHQLPLVISNRLIVCSTEGLFEFQRRSPADVLRDALITSGPDSRAITDLLQQFGHTELLIMALEILINEVPQDNRIKDKAASLFFCLRDNTVVENSRVNEPWSPTNDDSIAEWRNKMRSPLHASTPHNLESRQQNNIPISPLNVSMNFTTQLRYSSSNRHNALYLFFARLVQPIWTKHLCLLNGITLETIINPSEMAWLAKRVKALATVIDKYRLIPQYDQQKRDNALSIAQGDAVNLERQSICSLKKLMLVTSETLSLWVLLTSLNLTAISAGIDPLVKTRLASKLFFELVDDSETYSSDVIRALIKYYLGDEAGTKELSEMLRRECPILYSAEDACVTNAMEHLRQASHLPPGPGRRKMIATAADMLNQSIVKVPLNVVGEELAKLGGHEFIVDLCLLRAQKDDPRQLANFSYKNGRSIEDQATRIAEESRQKSYEVLTNILNKVHESKHDQTTESEAITNFNLMTQRVFASEDELAHAAVFRWMISKNMSENIIQSKSRFVESFLTHEISTGGAQRFLDLLWRWYEKNASYGKAANLLARLASSANEEITLAQRLTYLSHAIICAESSNDVNVRGSLDELKDKVEVTRVQLSIKESLENIAGNSTAIRDAIKTLTYGTFTLKELLVNFAIPYQLYRCQLAILHCGNSYDNGMIENVWENLLDSELSSENDPTEQIIHVLKELNTIYGKTNYFPSVFIAQRLLDKGSGSGGSHIILPPAFFVPAIDHLGMEIHDFIKLLLNEYRTGDPWQNETGIKYLVDVTIAVLEHVLSRVHKLPNMQQLQPTCDSLLSALICDANDLRAANSLRQNQPKLKFLKQRFSGLS